jgi:hypothetical protein
MNKFKIDYDKKELTLHYEGNVFLWNINEGDVGDFWSSFTTKGILKDINFHQENEEQKPSLVIYGVVQNETSGTWLINTKDATPIEKYEAVGDVENYFGSDMTYKKQFYVDIPQEDKEEWKNTGTFETREEAIKYAQEKFGADENGMVSLISQS